MAQAALQAPQTSARLRRLAAVGLLALSTSGCLTRSPETTGSLGDSAGTPAAGESWRTQSETWGRRFDANPGDVAAAINYARALRGLDQHAQALAVLQQAAIRNPKHFGLLGAYGKALADVGRLKEAADVLSRAHLPERPDWRILSAQGAVADQMNDHALAQQYYEAALRIAPNEPSVLSNLGLSYALAKRLGDAERVLKQASAQPNADARVRQNLALVLGLQGKFPEAEEVLRRDLPPEAASANLAALRGMVSQPNSWNAIRRTGRQTQPVQTAAAPNG
jgi:Flp pilus assembly protein TadD